MRVEGNLIKWNDDRGFGFIALNQGGSEIFVHVSAFPKDGQRPNLGERVTFEIEVDNDGKKRVKNLICPNRPAARTARQQYFGRPRKRQGIFAWFAPLVVVIFLIFYVYGKFSHSTVSTVSQVEVAAQPSEAIVSTAFHCDGRKYCSQMTSCAEATFFLKNCPSVEMDGNHDGVPCEKQWCN